MPAANNIRSYLSKFPPLFFRRELLRSRNRIVVIGIGGCGCNMVCYAKKHSSADFEDLICDCDKQNLNAQTEATRLSLKRSEDAEVNASQVTEKVLSLWHNPAVVIIATGAGGKTGSVVTPTVAERIKGRGILTFTVVVTPFGNEGTVSESTSAKCISDLKKHSDGLFIINNQSLAESFSKGSVSDYFNRINEMFTRFVDCIAAMSRK